jgi:hypothetical protein
VFSDGVSCFGDVLPDGVSGFGDVLPDGASGVNAEKEVMEERLRFRQTSKTRLPSSSSWPSNSDEKLK